MKKNGGGTPVVPALFPFVSPCLTLPDPPVPHLVFSMDGVVWWVVDAFEVVVAVGDVAVTGDAGYAGWVTFSSPDPTPDITRPRDPTSTRQTRTGH